MKSFMICIITLMIMAILPQESFSTDNTPLKWGYLPLYTRISPEDLEKRIEKYDIISCTGYMINGYGKITVRQSEKLKKIEAAVSRKKKLHLPLITFTDTSAGQKVLADPALRSKAALSLHRFMTEKNLRGIHMDIENLNPSYSRNITIFLKEIRILSPGKLITFAAYPPIQENNRYRKLHNLEEISPYLDLIVIMCYDMQAGGRKPGPVTDISWAEKNVSLAVSLAGRDKIILGIPYYGYCYSNGKIFSVYPSYIKRYGSLKLRRDKSGSAVLIEKGNICYISDMDTAEKMKEIAKKLKIRGWALWRIDFQ